jgi:hypothetical protein
MHQASITVSVRARADGPNHEGHLDPDPASDSPGRNRRSSDSWQRPMDGSALRGGAPAQRYPACLVGRAPLVLSPRSAKSHQPIQSAGNSRASTPRTTATTKPSLFMFSPLAEGRRSGWRRSRVLWTHPWGSFGPPVGSCQAPGQARPDHRGTIGPRGRRGAATSLVVQPKERGRPFRSL